jgi:hypothetical protein
MTDDEYTEPTAEDYACAAAYLERTATPAGAFAELVGELLNPAPTPDLPTADPAPPPGPRQPRPDMSQGSGANGSEPSPEADRAMWVAAMQARVLRPPTGMWHPLLTDTRYTH